VAARAIRARTAAEVEQLLVEFVARGTHAHAKQK
jgi:hypothetical protein